MNLNKVFVLGNVTRDPEVRAMPSGQQVVNFGIATNRFYTDQAGVKKQDTEFHNIVAFGKMADTISRYVTKGSLLLIEGRIKTSSWEDKNGGGKRSRTEIIAEGMQLGPRGMGTGAPTAGNFQKPMQSSAPKQATPMTEDIPVIQENQMPPGNFVSTEEPSADEIDVKDIPF